MSLADRLPTLEPRPSPNDCITCTWYRGLPERDKLAFNDLAERRDITRAWLLELCSAEEGLDCGETSFRRHMQNHHNKWLNGQLR